MNHRGRIYRPAVCCRDRHWKHRVFDRDQVLFGARSTESGRYDLGTGPFGLIGNLIWLVLAGWWLALGHVLTAIVLAVTIVGIPFAWAHLKLAGIALWPIGKEIVAADAVPFSRSMSD